MLNTRATLLSKNSVCFLFAQKSVNYFPLNLSHLSLPPENKVALPRHEFLHDLRRSQPHLTQSQPQCKQKSMTVRSPAYGRTTIIISIDKDGIIFYKMNVYKMNAADNFSMEKIFLNCKTSKLGILKKEWNTMWSSVEMDDTKTNHLPTKPISNDLAPLDDLDSLR